MKSHNLFCSFFIAFLLAGCVERASSIRTEESIKQSTATQAQLVSPLLTPSASTINTLMPTMIAPTSMISPTVAGKPIEDNRIEDNCVQIMPELPENSTYPGKLILDEEKPSIGSISPLYDYINRGNEVYFYDFSAHRQIPIPEVYADDIRVSTNGTKYALRDERDGLVKIYSVDGQLLDTVSVDKDYRLTKWLGNKDLLFMIANIEDGTLMPFPGKVETASPPDFLAVDLSTKTQRILRSNFPDVEGVNRINWEEGGVTAYNLDLTAGVYLAYNDNNGDNKYRYVLFNPDTGTKIAEITPGYEIITPKWSPDGSKLAVYDQGNQISIVSLDGKINRITNFPEYGKTEGKRYGFFFDHSSWSPDSRYLALWLVSSDENGLVNVSLGILDIGTQEIKDLCIPFGYFNTNRPTLPSLSTPVWSPNSKYLSVRANNRDGGALQGSFDVLVIDPKEKRGAKIAENVAPIGWIDTNKE